MIYFIYFIILVTGFFVGSLVEHKLIMGMLNKLSNNLVNRLMDEIKLELNPVIAYKPSLVKTDNHIEPKDVTGELYRIEHEGEIQYLGKDSDVAYKTWLNLTKHNVKDYTGSVKYFRDDKLHSEIINGDQHS